MKNTKLNGAKLNRSAEAKHFGRGRPTKYNADYVKFAKSLARLGATDEDLASAFDISVMTIRR